MTSYQTHYISESIVNEDESPDGIDIITELVEPGQLLLTQSVVEGVKSAISFEDGENTAVSADGLSVSAKVYGYPKLTVTKSAQKDIAIVNILPLISPSYNLMEASLNLMPAIAQRALLDPEQIATIVTSAGIKYGIDRFALEEAVESVHSTNLPVLDRIIARGKAPIDGKDAYLRMEIEIGPLPGKLLSNGSIDFRERQMFVGIKKGQLIATKVPPVPGKPGCDIRGEAVQAKDGKDIVVKITGDTDYDVETGTVRATVSGVLCVVNNDTLRVATKQKIEGDISYATGNVRSRSNIEISGTVQPGFLVSVQGNLLIGGSVQSANITCRGNLDIKGGIVGTETNVEARGDIDAKYTERASLLAGGNIVVRKGSYYATLRAGGSIHCPENVKLIGGVVSAGGSISAGQIGSEAGTVTEVAAGVDPNRFRLYSKLMEEYETKLKKMELLITRFGPDSSKNIDSVCQLEVELQHIQKDLSRINLIPGTPESSLGDSNFFNTDATITVHGLIAAGIPVRIGNEVMVLKSSHRNCIIGQDRRTGAIAINKRK